MILFFYILASLSICSSAMTIISRNSVHSVLWLIFTFCNVAGLMILIGAEYFGMMIVIIYVGAIAILFLFVVMMLNISLSEFKSQLDRESTLVPMVVACLLCINLITVILFGVRDITPTSSGVFHITPAQNNVNSIGAFLYTDFVLPFEMAGIILFIAMVGSIVLTIKIRNDSKKQDVKKQSLRNKMNSISLVSIPSKTGVKDIDYK